MDFSRTIILGNSGSGKSWLAKRIAKTLGTEAIDLDSVHWEPGGYNVARDKVLAIEAVRQAAGRPAWIIEGVYGWLAQEAISRATALIWLDTPVDECVSNLRQRGLRRVGDPASLAALLDWASDYLQRQSSSSFVGHERIFETFRRQKFRLSSRRDVDKFLTQVRSI
jgi:adenylate kinase family enzyme